MAELRCPEHGCWNQGEIVGRGIRAMSSDGRFERRGKIRRRAVFKCSECEAILLVRVGLFGRVTAQAVDDDTWVLMESAWGHVQSERRRNDAEAGIAASAERRRERTRAQAEATGRTVPCPQCERYFRDERALAAHTSAVHSEPM